MNVLVDMINNPCLDKGVRQHIARALRRMVVVETQDILGLQKIPREDILGLQKIPREDRLMQGEIFVGKNEGKIACIKLVRTRCNLGLKEAKDLVEAEFNRLGLSFYNTADLYNKPPVECNPFRDARYD